MSGGICLDGHIGPIPMGGDSSWREQLGRLKGLVCSFQRLQRVSMEPKQ